MAHHFMNVSVVSCLWPHLLISELEVLDAPSCVALSLTGLLSVGAHEKKDSPCA